MIKNWQKFNESSNDKLLSILKKENMIDMELCNIESNKIEIYDIPDKPFEYFLDNYLALEVDNQGGLDVYYHMYEEDIDNKEAEQVKEYIYNKLSAYFKTITNHI